MWVQVSPFDFLSNDLTPMPLQLPFPGHRKHGPRMSRAVRALGQPLCQRPSRQRLSFCSGEQAQGLALHVDTPPYLCYTLSEFLISKRRR